MRLISHICLQLKSLPTLAPTLWLVTFLPDTKVWFEFFTDTSSAGKFPLVQFLAENSLNSDPAGNNPPFTMTLHQDAANYPTYPGLMDQAQGDATTFFHDYDRDNKYDWRLKAPDLPGTGSGPKRYFLTMQRQGPALNENIISYTTFGTTLTYIYSKELYVEEENTWVGADDIRFQWAYDGDGTSSCSDAGANCYGPVELDDEATWGPTASVFHGSFVDKLTPRLWDDETKLSPLYKNSIEGLGLAPSSGGSKTFTWATDYNADDSEYWYDFHYCLSHEKAWAEACQ